MRRQKKVHVQEFPILTFKNKSCDPGKINFTYSSMAGGHKLLASQIDNDLGHKGFEFGGKKEDNKGVLFYLLLCSGDAPWWPKSVRKEVAGT